MLVAYIVSILEQTKKQNKTKQKSEIIVNAIVMI